MTFLWDSAYSVLLLLLLLFSISISSSCVTDMMTVDLNAPCCDWECDIVWPQRSAAVTLNWRKKPFMPPLFLSAHQFTYFDCKVSPWPCTFAKFNDIYITSVALSMGIPDCHHPPFVFDTWDLQAANVGLRSLLAACKLLTYYSTCLDYLMSIMSSSEWQWSKFFPWFSISLSIHFHLPTF